MKKINKIQFMRDLREFISIKSETGNDTEMEKAMFFCKKRLMGIDGLELHEYEHNGNKSLFATTSGVKNPQLIIHGHIDVVSGKNEQFSLKISQSHAYGRGTYDMKTALLVFLYLAQNLPKKLLAQIGLMIVSDEEIGGHDGTKFLASLGILPKLFITGEPSRMKVYTKARGIIWAEIKYKGRAAHGGLIWNGTNAIVEMSRQLNNFIKKYPLPRKKRWMTTYNFGNIAGGTNINTVPDECTLSVDIRCLPTETEDNIINNLKKYFPECSIKINLSEPSISNPLKNPYIDRLAREVCLVTMDKKVLDVNYGSTDARYYSNLGIPSLSFGLIGANAHGSDEFVDLLSVWDYEQVMLNFINKLS